MSCIRVYNYYVASMTMGEDKLSKIVDLGKITFNFQLLL